ncbi:MAG: hypothetical protein U0R70_17920 [Solirubrobacteraceae bacterium]
MPTVHLVLGVSVMAAFVAVAGWGAWCWWRVVPSENFWRMLRAAQVLLVVQVLLGGVLLAAGYAPKGDLHVLYGLLPIVVLFFAEQLRIGSAQAILDSRGFDSAQDVGTLPEDQQRSVVLAIVRREIGTMTLAAIVCAGLVVRAGAVSGHLF